MEKIEQELKRLKAREQNLKADIDASIGDAVQKTKKTASIAAAASVLIIFIFWLKKPKRKRSLKAKKSSSQNQVSQTAMALFLPYLIEFLLKKVFSKLSKETKGSDVHK